MTLQQALDAFDRAFPNDFDRAERIRWLSELDGRVWDQILRHRNPALPMPVYDTQTPGDTELAIPQPYTGLYLLYSRMQADLAYGEVARYNNSARLFNTQLMELHRHWIRTHLHP